MKDLFKEILNMDNVYGVLFADNEGKILFQEFSPALGSDPASMDWKPFFDSLAEAREATLVFEHRRVYLRRASTGHALVLLGLVAPVSMVRLALESLVPELEKATAPKGGFRRLFRRK